MSVFFTYGTVTKPLLYILLLPPIKRFSGIVATAAGLSPRQFGMFRFAPPPPLVYDIQRGSEHSKLTWRKAIMIGTCTLHPLKASFCDAGF